MKEVPDIIAANLIILFIGYNPGVRSAMTGHHFAGYSNRFWKLLYASDLTPRLIKPEEDQAMLQYGLGITNIVARPSRTAAEITPEEYGQGREILQKKLSVYKPAIACYAGIGVYKEFSGMRNTVCGQQLKGVVDNVIDFVVPSPSGLNRMVFSEQLHFYLELNKMIIGHG
jgi:TDG/mug DNA glycosylase family protein